MLRKITPYLIFLALGALFVVLKPVWQTAFTWLYHAVPVAGPSASSAQIEAAQASGGWVPSGTVASKFLTAAAAYVLFTILPWLVQHLTHPAPTRWAKQDYSRAFYYLSVQEQFASYGRLQLVNVIRAAAALLFAALVV